MPESVQSSFELSYISLYFFLQTIFCSSSQLVRYTDKCKNWRDVAKPESVQSCFELSIRFLVFFSSELFLVAVHSWIGIQTNVKLEGCSCARKCPVMF